MFVKFDDGSQKSIKPHDIMLAAELPVGQSVMVMREDGYYESGMIMRHTEAREGGAAGAGGVVYHVERDDGVRQRWGIC